MIKILNVENIEERGLQELLDFCERRLKREEGAFLVPMNPIKVIKARSAPDFQDIIDRADWVFADAWGICWATRMLYSQEMPVTPGWQVMLRLIEHAAATNRSVYFLGTRDEILAEAMQRLRNDIPGVQLAGSHHGFFDQQQEAALFADIQQKNPDYVFVAMGEKLQEEVISRLRTVHPRAVYMGVGGSIDLVAGRQPMPPQWMREHHLEWLFRAVRQPFRLSRFRAIPVFVMHVMREKLRMSWG